MSNFISVGNIGIKHPASIMIALCLILCTPLSHAGLGPATTARDWCKKKTLHYLEKRGYAPYNWEATTYIDGDNYVTEGEWSVDVDEIKVQCTTRKHAKSGKYKILDVDISDDRESKTHTKNQ